MSDFDPLPDGDPVETPSPEGLKARLRDAVVRNDLGYGRKLGKKGLAAIAQYGPVDVHHYDDTTGETTIVTAQDVNAIAEANKRDRLSGHDGYSPDRSFRRVANIPKIVVDMLYKRGINVLNDDDWPKVAAFLDDPENLAWRTDGGASTVSRKAVRTYPTEAWDKRRNPGWRGEID